MLSSLVAVCSCPVSAEGLKKPRCLYFRRPGEDLLAKLRAVTHKQIRLMQCRGPGEPATGFWGIFLLAPLRNQLHRVRDLAS